MNDTNLVRGLLLAAIALAFLIQAPAYKIGTLTRPGAGLFPMIVGGMLLVVSLTIIVRSRFVERIPLDFRFRNIALVTVGIVLFAVLSEFINMLAGIAGLVILASLASPDFSVRRTGILVVALSLVAIAMKKGLGVNLPLY